MGGLLGRLLGGKNQQALALSGVNVQASTYGLPIPIVYGQNRISGNIIWYGDFKANPQGNSSGKGGNSGPTSYTYQAAIAIGLCEGPISTTNQAVVAVAVTNGGGGFTSAPAVVFSGGGGTGAAGTAVISGGEVIGVIMTAGGSGYTSEPAVSFSGGGGSGATANAEIAVNGVGAIWQGSTETDAHLLGLSAVFNGAYTQTPWGYLTTNHAGQDLAYRGLAYVTHSSFNLDSSAALPNLNFEILGRLQFGGGIVDANPKDVLSDFLTNTDYGAMWPTGKLGDLTQYSNYCVANGIFVSPALTSQKAAHEFTTELMKMTNSEPFYSEGVLKVVPYGDQAVTGNGVTFTPNVTPQYDLGDTDFQGNKKDPVKVTRSTPADAYNQVIVEFHDRSNAYAIATATATDQANVELYGLLQMPVVQIHGVCSAAIARNVAQLILQRTLYIRNTYEFKLGWRYCRLEPMDIVTLTDTNLGLNRAPVRITKIEEDGAGLLTVTAEEYPAGVSSHSVYGSQAGNGYAANYNVPAGNVNAPIIFEAPVEIAESGLEVWMALSGGALFGGADVYISSDGSTYNYAGRVTGKARMGTLTATLPVGSDPDTTNTLAVDLTESDGTLISASSPAILPLCFVGGEFISYQTATLTAANKYNLTNMRRGCYESAIASHSSGAPFARLDQAVFKYPYVKAQIGTTIYVKCCSLNIYGGGLQSVADVSPFTHVIQGPPLPENVTGFNAQQLGGTVVFKWNEIASYALKGYDIRFAAQGTTNWDNMLPLTESARGTEMTNAGVPPGTWTFAIRARDLADQLSASMATVDLAVVNESPTVLVDNEEPAWPGTVSGFYRHWTGVLVPMGQYPCSHYTAWEDFNQYVPDPVAQSVYTTPTLDTGFDDTLRVWFADAAVLGPGQTSATADLKTYLDTWLTGQSDPAAFTIWSMGTLQVRYIKGQLVMNNTPGSLFYIADFDVTADRAPKIENSATNLAVAPGGTAVTFPSQYHEDPMVKLTVVANSALNATASPINPTGFTAHVWDHTGADVGGTVQWEASGV